MAIYCTECNWYLPNDANFCSQCASPVLTGALRAQREREIQERLIEEDIRRQIQDIARPASDEFWQREASWVQLLTGSQGTPSEVFFRRMGIATRGEDCGKKLHELCFGEAGWRGDIFLFISQVLETFDKQERKEYFQLIKPLALI